MNFEIRLTKTGWKLYGYTEMHGEFVYHYRDIRDINAKIDQLKLEAV